jgi:serine/threonine protein kinase
MTCTEYSKMLQITPLSFEGHNITDCCRDFLKGLLEKKFTDRFSFDRTLTHPWLVLIKKKIDDIVEKFQHDSEKMISILNSTKVTNEDFINKNYQEIKIIKEESLEPEVSSQEIMGKKRKRNKSNL